MDSVYYTDLIIAQNAVDLAKDQLEHVKSLYIKQNVKTEVGDIVKINNPECEYHGRPCKVKSIEIHETQLGFKLVFGGFVLTNDLIGTICHKYWTVGYVHEYES